MEKINRRTFNIKLTQGLAGAALLSNMPLSYGLNSGKQDKKLGIALVGLGGYAGGQIAPALLNAQHCYLAGIVTGTPSKEKEWMDKYNIPRENVYNYENFDSIAKNDAIDVVYVVLPNSMHAEFCIRAARAGKHVITEKPMATSVAECDAIINACKENGVKLGVGYRMQTDPYTQEIKRYGKEKPLGNVKYVRSDSGFIAGSWITPWRLQKKYAGGGALMDMGVYAIQCCIYGAGANPVSISAQEFKTKPDYFIDVDETITAQMKFSNDVIGNVFTSYNANGNNLFVSYERGWVELNPAHSYGPLSGRTSRGEEIKFPFQRQYQQTLQLDAYAQHVLTGSPNYAPGEMGKRDLIIVEAIYKSIAEGGKTIPLDLGDMGIVRV
ncbi:Gfo/Idh/MocA family oxidoreductase [Flavobacteriaceae bacterium XHP0103]|uniref:Gfo/Idh/MocA family protein n=1 Tax=Marixanthotalea marina TaxID=2844359 RepID=UPI002989BCB2|nr:Gfo/Idh/MocA family oxidoreductase [Marixanthotalea marina]MBU3820732.1 Gfo/Idh/MocA family oxidoreductase [Marixanthotalea marina]